MNNDEDVLTKLEPRCITCLCEETEKFSTENMLWIVNELLHSELPRIFKYVPCIFCVDCVSYLEQFKKFKATVETSFVTLERLVQERGLNKIDCLEMLELIPRVSPDPNAVKVEVVKPIKRLWKSVGRPRRDGTPAQPRFFKFKPKTPPVYDSDSYKSKSSDDENFCRRSDNEEWNPDTKNVNPNKKYKTKHNNVPKVGGTGKRGRPKKILQDPTQVLNKTKTEPKVKPHNGMISKSEQFNGNHSKMFVKRPRGRPPKTVDSTKSVVNHKTSTSSIKKKVLQKSYFNDSNISSNDERDSKIKKGRGRPRKNPLATTIKMVVNKKLKKRIKNSVKPSITSNKIHKKRGRPPKNPVSTDNVNKQISSEISRKRKRNAFETSMDWVTETEDEEKVIVEKNSERTQSFGMIRKNYKDFILTS